MKSIFTKSLLKNFDSAAKGDFPILSLKEEKDKKNCLKPENKNTNLNDIDFPSLENLPEPTIASSPEATVGTGKGGNIVTKSYNKSAAHNKLDTIINEELAKVPEKVEASKHYNLNNKSVLDKLYNKSKNKITDILLKSYNNGTLPLLLTTGSFGSILGSLVALGTTASQYLGGNPNPNILKNLLIGSSLGTLAGSIYGLNYKHKKDQKKKYASYKFIKRSFAIYPPYSNNLFDTDINAAFNRVSSKILSDNNLSIFQKNELINYIKQQPSSILQDLDKLTGAAIGGGIGYLIANYLLGMGKRGNIIMSILGAIMGHNLLNNKDTPLSHTSMFFTPKHSISFINNNGEFI